MEIIFPFSPSFASSFFYVFCRKDKFGEKEDEKTTRSELTRKKKKLD